MIFTTSTESLLNRIPKFGYSSGAFEKMRRRNTSATSASLKRKPTASKPCEDITPPATTGAQPSGHDLSLPVHFIDAFEPQQERKGSFLNHTPRDLDMRTPTPLEVYRPLQTSDGNYSRPRASGWTTSLDASHASTSPLAYDSSTDSHMADNELFIHPMAPAELESGMIPVELNSTTAPVELGSKERESSSSSKGYQPSETPLQRSCYAPMTRSRACEPCPAFPVEHARCQASVSSASPPVNRNEDTKRQHRQTTFTVPTPHLTNAAHDASLELLRKANRDTIRMLPKIETGRTGEFGTFGVIQRYFDSQMGGPVLSPTWPGSQEMSLPKPRGPALSESFNEQTEISPLDEMEVDTLPRVVPDGSPRQLTNPDFPRHAKYSLSIDSDNTMGVQRDSWASEKIGLLDKELHAFKTRDTKRLDVKQAERAGSSQMGRLAPPILSHDALTTSDNLRLNDLCFYLKHTGPPTNSQPVTRLRRKRTRLFKNKSRPSFADRFGSVQGSPQRVQRQVSIPTCAREMTTSGGVRHLKIVIPTDSPCTTQTGTMAAASYSGAPGRFHHVSTGSNQDRLFLLLAPPLYGPEAERSFSEPFPVGPCSLERGAAETLSAEPSTPDHPLSGPCTSREEQIRARTLRDSQRIKRTPLPGSSSEAREQHVAEPPPPLQSAGTPVDSSSTHDKDSEGKVSPGDVARLRDKVRLLQSLRRRWRQLWA